MQPGERRKNSKKSIMETASFLRDVPGSSLSEISSSANSDFDDPPPTPELERTVSRFPRPRRRNLEAPADPTLRARRNGIVANPAPTTRRLRNGKVTTRICDPSNKLDDLRSPSHSKDPDAMPSEANQWRFQYGSPSGRTAKELDELLEIPRMEKEEPNLFEMKKSYTRFGNRPRKGLAEQLVNKMERQAARELETSETEAEDDED